MTYSIIEMNNDDEIEQIADNCLSSSQKQAAYYEQESYQKGTIKAMSASELRKHSTQFYPIMKLIEHIKLVVNSITLSLNEITQIDGKSCGIF